jgi:hypothetical protein
MGLPAFLTPPGGRGESNPLETMRSLEESETSAQVREALEKKD